MLKPFADFFMTALLNLRLSKQKVTHIGKGKPANPIGDNAVRLVGQGYNIINDKVVSPAMFTFQTRDTGFGVLVPTPANFNKITVSRCFMEEFQDQKEMMDHRMKSLGLNFGFDAATFSVGYSKGNNVACDHSSLVDYLAQVKK